MKILTDNIYSNRQPQNNLNMMSFSGRRFKENPDDLADMTRKAKNIAKEIGYTVEDIGDNVSDHIKEIGKKANGLREKLPSWMPFSKKPKPPNVNKTEYVKPPKTQEPKTLVKNEPLVNIPTIKAEPPIPPKPEFKYTEANPIEFAKEKEMYIESIISHANKGEEVALEVMNQFDKYGSREKLIDLSTTLALTENKTDGMVQGFLKIYKKFARLNLDDPSEFDASLLRFTLQEFQNVISKDSIRLMIKEFERTGKDAGDLTDLRGFTHSNTHYFMKQRFNFNDLDEIDKLAQEAESVVSQRVYKDSE